MDIDNAKNRVNSPIDIVNNKNNVDGLILDYIRTPGWTGYQDNVKQLVEYSRNRLYSNKLLGATIMPEKNGANDHGQNIDLMKPYLDEIFVMAYKGNYHANSDWIKNIMSYFQNKVSGSNCKATGIIQSYKSDDDITKLSRDELYYDMNQVISSGAYGTGLFRAKLNNLDNQNPYEPHINS
jgi:hypothetical protein